MIIRLYLVISVLTLITPIYAQSPKDAVEYMEYFTSREAQLSENYLDYISEVAHGSRARKMEKRRQELISSVRQALNDANRLKPFNGDASLRNAFKKYWDVLLKVLNEDYKAIVNMEEVAEQSYDAMEAYLLAQDKASEVLTDAFEAVQPIYSEFAAKNNIKLVDGNSKMSKRLKLVANVNGYDRPIFLIYFKSLKQELYMLDALSKKDLNAVEQNRSSLLKVAIEGLSNLDTIKDFRGDGALRNACRKVLEFHKVEAEKTIQSLVKFLALQADFEKAARVLNDKPANSRTKEEIDQYNKKVNEYNAALNKSNQEMSQLTSGREKVITHWENTRKRFMETYIPKSK